MFDIDKSNKSAIIKMRRQVGSIFLLTGHPLIYFKEVIVLRVKETSVKNENAIPDDALEALARCLYPMMVSFFESAEGQCEFAEWQSRKNTEETTGNVGMAKIDENKLAG